MARTAEFDEDAILQKAMNVFWEKGYNGTSMQHLVDATGLNRSSIYNSFESKLNLYQRTLILYQKRSGGNFQRALVQAKNPLHAVQLIFEVFLPEILQNDKGLGCFTMNCASEMANQNGDIQKWLLAGQKQTMTLFEQLVADGQEQGSINTQRTASQYAYYLLSAFQGFRMTGILVRDKKVLQDIIDQTVAILK